MRNPRQYWDKCAVDKDVDLKYIADVPTEISKSDLDIKGKKVLEIGCGVGRLLENGWYGIDISPKMLIIAKTRKPKCHYKLTTGDIPYKNEMFDDVYSYLVFQHLKPDEVKKYIEESYRVLKKNGVLTFQLIIGNEREPYSNHYSISEVGTMLRGSGFKEFDIKQSDAHYQWQIIRAKK